MTFPKDIPQPSQPDQGGDALSSRPRRLRRERPIFPSEPITIPQERKDVAMGLLTQTYEAWQEGRHLDSLKGWFSQPAEIRHDAVDSVLLQEASDRDRSLRSAQDDTEGQPEYLVLKHYALFATEEIKKIILPSQDQPITHEDVSAVLFNPGDHNGEKSFYFKTLSLGLGMGIYLHNLDDFSSAGQDIIRSFELEEARELLLNLLPVLNRSIEPDSQDIFVKHHLISNFGLVSGIRNAELLTDPRLADEIQEPILGEGPWVNHLENYFSQGQFPSPAFFEEAFKRLNPEDADSKAALKATKKELFDTDVPASAYYFNMLRKINQLPARRQRNPDFGKGREEKVISYLLNDTFMQHVLPYIDEANLYSDDLVTEGTRAGIIYNLESDSTGEEARVLKVERFGEVIKAAIEYARQQGDIGTVQRLQDREVDGVKFADFVK